MLFDSGVPDGCVGQAVDEAAALVPLQALPAGAQAVIDQLHPPADADDRELLLRLIELGFLPGEPVRIVANARAGRRARRVRLKLRQGSAGCGCRSCDDCAGCAPSAVKSSQNRRGPA